MHPADCEHLPAAGALRGSVIVLHGYGASGAVHAGDGRAFAEHGVEVLLPDAPGHGCRDDGRLAKLALLDDGRRRAAILDIARQWIPEVRMLAAERRGRGARRVVVVGTSMGGFAALGALRAPRVLDAVAALLTSPELLDEEDLPQERPPVLIGVADRDEAVPPGPAKAFAARIDAELHEYPHSEHLMREVDWLDLWSQTASFVRRNLSLA